MQGRLIALDGEQVVGPDGSDAGDLRIAGDGVDGDHGAFEAAAAASLSSSTGMASISLLLSSMASWPSTRRVLVAKAETRCSAARPLARSWLRRTVLPSMAIVSRGSGQQATTQSMKQAANSSGSIRFIMMCSQRPEGTPQWKGRNRRRNARWALPQSEMASKLSHSAIVAQTHTSKTSLSSCATLSGLRLSSIREK